MKDNSTHKKNSWVAPCPTCGNDDMDGVIWDDPDGGTEHVVCGVCGTRYNPFTGELQWPF